MAIDFSEVSVEVVREDAEGLDAVSNQNMTAQVTVNWRVCIHFVAAKIN